MTLNEISNPEDNQYKITNSLDITSYENLEKRMGYHWEEGRSQARECNLCLNGMITILLEQNPDWSIYRCATEIAGNNQHLEGFSRSTILKSLDDSHKQLLDLSKSHPSSNNITEESAFLKKQKVIEESSPENTKRLIRLIEALQKDVEERDLMLIDQKEELNKIKQDKANLDPEQLKKISDFKNIEFEHNENLLEKNREIEGLKERLKDKDSQIEDLGYELDKASVNIEPLTTEQQKPEQHNDYEDIEQVDKDVSYAKHESKGDKVKSLKERMYDWHDNITNETSKVLQHWTGLNAKEIIRTDKDVIISSTDTFRRRLIMLWTDDEVTFARQVLSNGVPLLADTLHIVEEEWENRRKKAKLLSR